MKKTKILIATLVASVMLIGAGFASWTDALNIKNTVNTGDMKVEFDQNLCFAGDCDTYVNATVSFSPKLIEVTANNLYPGTGFFVNTGVKNTGTIPAKFNNAVVTFDTTATAQAAALKDALVIPKLTVFVFDASNIFNSSFEIGNNIPISDLQSVLNQKMSGVRLDPGQWCRFGYMVGDRMDTFYSVALPLGTLGQYQELQDDTLKFDIQLNWKQHNVQ